MRHAPKAGVRHLRTVREILASHVPTLYNVIALLCAAVLLAAGGQFPAVVFADGAAARGAVHRRGAVF